MKLRNARYRALRSVFDYQKIVTPRDQKDFVHLAANARVVNRDDGLRSR